MQSLISSKFFFFVTALVLSFHFFVDSKSAGAESYKNGMVVSASAHATKVGIDILMKGGNAIDAAVAVGFALAVTYPSAGNIGGGGFLVLNTSDGLSTTIDFRETAPKLAHRDMYLDGDGNFLPELSQEGVTSAGVPGSVAGLIYALEKFGTMPLAEVIQPAINLAENGFPLEKRLANLINNYANDFKKYESSASIFVKDNGGFEEGDIFVQTDLANTLKKIRDFGRAGFYEGEIAELIVEQMHGMGGLITFDDLKSYQPVEREPVTGSYRSNKIISMGPPSAGGIALVQLLNILENFEIGEEEWGSASYYHKLIEAMKFVYADRSKHLGDSGFYPVPVNWLLSKKYAKEIFHRIRETAIPSEEIQAGNPFELKESVETTHFSIYDSYGNAVSVTTTINSTFGSRLVVDGAGFILNNEMDDFSSKPGVPNQFGLTGSEANAIEPGKRMLSSMTPVIVLKDDKPFLIAGSPGGSTIITVVLQVLLNCIDFKMIIDEAIDKPRIHHQWLPDLVDYEEFDYNPNVKTELAKREHKFGKQTKLGRVEGILIDNNRKLIYGATDPRGFGLALGF